MKTYSVTNSKITKQYHKKSYLHKKLANFFKDRQWTK